jgi:hypothetical protein
MEKTNNSTGSSKTAIVVIHGMGNQYPMETITKFAENFFTKKIYSAPERVSGSLDHRKLIGYDGKNYRYDCFEFYWAHLVEEPKMAETLSWIFNLLYFKKSSERFKLYKLFLQVFLPIVILSLLYGIYWYYENYINGFSSKSALFQLEIIFSPIVFYYLLKNIIGVLSKSFGDVIRYTVPHPKNIGIRHKISQSAVTFLMNLHRDDSKYDKIVIIGHSLGSIIAYEMIVNTFGTLNKSFDKKSGVTRSEADNINQMDDPERRKAGLGPEFEWKVSDFITCGSPLCHAKMLMVENKDAFNKKVNKGEYPVCPANREDLFYPNKEDSNYFVPTHDSVFSFMKWTNIFFTNDAVGGNLKNIFGGDITDRDLKPKTYTGIRNSHSQYWNKEKEPESFEIIKDTLKIK